MTCESCVEQFDGGWIEAEGKWLPLADALAATVEKLMEEGYGHVDLDDTCPDCIEIREEEPEAVAVLRALYAYRNARENAGE